MKGFLVLVAICTILSIILVLAVANSELVASSVAVNNARAEAIRIEAESRAYQREMTALATLSLSLFPYFGAIVTVLGLFGLIYALKGTKMSKNEAPNVTYNVYMIESGPRREIWKTLEAHKEEIGAIIPLNTREIIDIRREL